MFAAGMFVQFMLQFEMVGFPIYVALENAQFPMLFAQGNFWFPIHFATAAGDA